MVRIAALIFDHNARRRIYNGFCNSGKGTAGGVEVVFFGKATDFAAAADTMHAAVVELRDPVTGQSTSPIIQRIRRRNLWLPIVAYMEHSPQRVRELLLAVRAGVNEVILREYDDIGKMAAVVLHMVEAVRVSNRVIAALSESFPGLPEWVPDFLRCAIRNAHTPAGLHIVEMELGKNRKTISGNLAAIGFPGAGKMMAWSKRLVEARVLDGEKGGGAGEPEEQNFGPALAAFIDQLRAENARRAASSD